MSRNGPFRSLAVVWEFQTPAHRGIVLMCISTMFFSIMHGLIRYMSSDIPPFQMVFFRSLFGWVIFLPLLLHSRFRILRTSQISHHAVLGLITVGSMLMFFTALSTTQLGTVTALSFTAPIFVAVLSLLFLSEKLRFYRVFAITMGFSGIVIISRPGLGPLNTGLLLVVASAFLWAMAVILIKVISRTDSSITIVAWMGVFLSFFSLGPALWVWQPLTFYDVLWVSALGLSAVIAQLALGQALKETDPTVVMPFDFLRMIWAVLIGLWLFSEVPDFFTWLGAGVIFSSGLLMVFIDRRAEHLC